MLKNEINFQIKSNKIKKKYQHKYKLEYLNNKIFFLKAIPPQKRDN